MESLDAQYIQLNRVSGLERAEFIKRTYKHVAGAVLAFICLEAFLLNMPGIESLIGLMMGGQFTWLIVLGIFMYATNQAEKMAHGTHDANKQYLGLGITILAYAIIFLPLISIAILKTGDLSTIKHAGVVSLALFGGLSAVVLTTKGDFSFLRSAITIGFFIAIGLIVAGILFGFSLGLWFSVGMVVLSAGSILYQTSNMIHKYSTDQHVGASVGLFASLMMLFWYVLQIFMSRD